MIRVSGSRFLAALRIFLCFCTRVTRPNWSYKQEITFIQKKNNIEQSMTKILKLLFAEHDSRTSDKTGWIQDWIVLNISQENKFYLF